MDENGDDGIDLEQVAEMLLALAAERREHAREACGTIERLLRAAPLTTVEEGGVDKLRLVLRPDTEERLRNMCELVACVDGHRLDDDAFLLTLALAVLRGPDELREHMLEVERVRERASGGAPPW